MKRLRGPNQTEATAIVRPLGVACLYPLILSLALASAGGSTDRASALSSLASGVAILFLPLILGRLADAVGIRQAYSVIIVLLVIAFAIILGTARITTRRLLANDEQAS